MGASTLTHPSECIANREKGGSPLSNESDRMWSKAGIEHAAFAVVTRGCVSPPDWVVVAGASSQPPLATTTRDPPDFIGVLESV